MTSMAQSCGAAFVASWTQSIIDLPTLFNHQSPGFALLLQGQEETVTT